MSIFEKDLPVTLCPTSAPDGMKYQGRLKQVADGHILVDTGHSLELAKDTEIRVEFRVDDSKFRFDTSIANLSGTSGLLLSKPKVIHRSKVREGPRVLIPLEMNFTLWTEDGRYQSRVLDISESGVRMSSAKPVRKGQLLSLDFYIKEAKSRVITQGLVAWARADDDNPNITVSGVHFTTITNETRKKLARYLGDVHTSQEQIAAE